MAKLKLIPRKLKSLPKISVFQTKPAHHIWFIGLIVLIISFGGHFRPNGTDFWKDTVASDGRGYYAYLPSIVLHGSFNFDQVLDREKQIYYDKLVRISPTSKLRKLDESQFRIFKEWYHSVIREMVTLKDFNGAPEWISRHTVDRIPVQRVQESLKLLQELGFLTRTANGFKQVDPLLTTDDEVSDLLVKQYHQQMIAQAQNALMQQPAERRDISALTFSIRRKDFSVLKKHLQLMRKELLNFQAGPGDGEEIVQVNIQLFPLSQE
jgi:uncharacterized protein (TIGR02147 family)